MEQTMKNVLVLGCNGMAGHTVSLYLQEKGFSVTGLARTQKIDVPTVLCDVTDFSKLRAILETGDYDTVVNCVGILNQFAQERMDEAVLVNSYLPHILAKFTSTAKTQIIQLSTDCVFSGKCGQYTEEDVCDGQTFYDRSKALGELNDEKNLTIRTSIVGPDCDPNGIGLLNWFMRQSGPVSGYTRTIWTGQTTLQLAKTIEQAVLQRLTGLHHLVPETSITKYGLLCLFNQYLRRSPIEIKQDDRVVLDKSLVRGCDGLDYQIPGYETMVSELAEWIRAHEYLYAHYQIKE